MTAKHAFDEGKLLDVIQLICNLCDDDKASLGLVKLNKALYTADMLHFIWKGKPLTGTEYVKQNFGPSAAGRLREALSALERSGKLRVTQSNHFGYQKIIFYCPRPPETNRLSDDERQLVGEVVDLVCRRSNRELSELAHDAAWEATPMGEIIPYESAFTILPTNLFGERRNWDAAEIEAFRSRRKHAS